MDFKRKVEGGRRDETVNVKVKVNGVPGLGALENGVVCEFGIRNAEFENRFKALEDEGIEKFGIGLCLAEDGRWKIGDWGASNPGNMDLREKQLMRHENYRLWYLM